MPRQMRKKSGTGIYHVMHHGTNRQDSSNPAVSYEYDLHGWTTKITTSKFRG